MTPSFLTEDVKQQIADHAASLPTEEVAGLILNDRTVIRADNIIEGSGLTEGGVQLDRTTGILIDDDLIIEHEEDLACIYHSHWSESTSGYLSFTDIDQSRFHQVPYLLYHTEFKVWDYFDPMYFHPAPLLERGNPKKLSYFTGWKFEYNRSDCAMLLRSYFFHNFGLTIPDYPRPADGEWYKNPAHTMKYLELMQDPANGFVQVNTSTPKKNDVILLRWFGSKNPSHAGIMVEDDKVLHIIENKLSEVVSTRSGNDIFGGHWKRGLHSVWRLKNQ